jgi:tetratricopeptide (TPR) repeat protein
MAWHNFYELKLEESLENIVEWELEEPYSAGPYVLGSHITENLEQYDRSVNFAMRGLAANPNHFILKNNLCYTLIKQNRLDKAKKWLMSFSSNLQQEELLFYNAISGLYEFKKGNVEKGRELYYQSFIKCKELGDQRLLSKAFLNLAIAEAERRTKNYIKFSEAALKNSKSQTDDPSIFFLRKQLLNLISSK